MRTHVKGFKCIPKYKYIGVYEDACCELVGKGVCACVSIEDTCVACCGVA